MLNMAEDVLVCYVSKAERRAIASRHRCCTMRPESANVSVPSLVENSLGSLHTNMKVLAGDRSVLRERHKCVCAVLKVGLQSHVSTRDAASSFAAAHLFLQHCLIFEERDPLLAVCVAPVCQ